MNKERPIEEIIGWIRNEHYGFWVTSKYASDSRHRAEVDDLLDAVTAWYPGLDIEIYQDGKTMFDGWNVIISLTDYDGSEAWNANTSGKTLLEALTVAVREIDLTPQDRP